MKYRYYIAVSFTCATGHGFAGRVIDAEGLIESHEDINAIQEAIRIESDFLSCVIVNYRLMAVANKNGEMEAFL